MFENTRMRRLLFKDPADRCDRSVIRTLTDLDAVPAVRRVYDPAVSANALSLRVTACCCASAPAAACAGSAEKAITAIIPIIAANLVRICYLPAVFRNSDLPP